LARNIVNTNYDDFSEEVREVTKKSILDTLGVILPATTLEKSCTSIYELAQEAGGKEESTLIGFGGKVPCLMAAFVNGSCAHALDFDDGITGDNPVHHPTASTFPAAFAVAEKIGGISGKDLITAVALGNDLSIRLASCPEGNIMMDYPFFPISIFGIFSAAAASAKLLKLNEVQLLNALGIALHRVGGTSSAVFAPDSDIRAIRDGFTNKDGVLSALMADKGISACKDAVEQLFKVYFNGRFNARPLTLDLGNKFRGSEAEYKIWPSCGQTHSYVRAALRLAMEHNINPDHIENVILTGSPDGEMHSKLPDAANPTTSIAAKFSIPFCVAVALVKRRVTINDFLTRNLANPDVIRIAAKTKFKIDPTFGSFTHAIVEVRTKGGQSYSFDMDNANQKKKGVSLDELTAKFKDCAGYSKKQLSKASVNKLINTILNLETVSDISEITDVLA
jgi:2-methylcitrate dehydratase PrpD